MSADDDSVFQFDPMQMQDSPATGDVDLSNLNSAGGMPDSVRAAVTQNASRWATMPMDQVQAEAQKDAVAAAPDADVQPDFTPAPPAKPRGKTSTKPDASGVFHFDPRGLTDNPATAKSSLPPDWDGFPTQIPPDDRQYEDQPGYQLTNWQDVPYSPRKEPDLVDTNATALKMTALGAQYKSVKDELSRMDTLDDYNAYLRSRSAAGGELDVFGASTPELTQEQFEATKRNLLDQRHQLLQDISKTYEEQSQQQSAMQNNKGDDWSLQRAMFHVKQGASDVAPMAAAFGASVLAPEAGAAIGAGVFGSTAYAKKLAEMKARGYDDDTAEKAAEAEGAIQTAVGAIPGSSYTAKLKSGLARGALTFGTTEAGMTAAAPASLYAEHQVTGEPLFDSELPRSAEEAAEDSAALSAVFGAKAAHHAPAPEFFQEQRAQRMRDLIDAYKAGSDHVDNIAGGAPPNSEVTDAGSVLGDQEEADEGVQGQGAQREVGAAASREARGDDLQRGQAGGSATGDAQQQGVVNGGVPTMITRAMRGQLQDMGFTDDMIRGLTPEQAWNYINSGRDQSGGSTPSVTGNNHIVDIDLSQFLKPEEIKALEDAGLAQNGRITNSANLEAARRALAGMPVEKPQTRAPQTIQAARQELKDHGFPDEAVEAMGNDDVRRAVAGIRYSKNAPDLDFGDNNRPTPSPVQGQTPGVAPPMFSLSPDKKPGPEFFSALQRLTDAGQGAPKKGGVALKQWLDGAQSRGLIKGAERNYLKVDDWLAANPDATRQQLADYVRNNVVQIGYAKYDKDYTDYSHAENVTNDARIDLINQLTEEEGRDYRFAYDTADKASDLTLPLEGVQQGHSQKAQQLIGTVRDAAQAEKNLDATRTKYHDYKTLGGTDYREHVMTMPNRSGVHVLGPDNTGTYGVYDRDGEELGRYFTERSANQAIAYQEKEHALAFHGPHYGTSAPVNQIGHTRLTTRVTEGESAGTSTHMEENQSDWSQYLRMARRRDALKQIAKERPLSDKEEDEVYKIRRRIADRNFPESPFNNTEDWALLGFKHALREAVEAGHDKVTWANGQMNAERYMGDGPDSEDYQERLKGMRGFYDDIMPKVVGKYVKRWGGKVDSTFLHNEFQRHSQVAKGGYDPDDEGGYIVYSPDGLYQARFGLKSDAESEAARLDNIEREKMRVHSVDITPAMRESVMEGQPMYSKNADLNAGLGPQGSMTAEEAQAALRQFGGRKLAERFKVMGSDELAHVPGINGADTSRINGTTVDLPGGKKQAILVHDNISKEQLPGIATHEAWHANSPLSPDEERELANAVRARARQNPDSAEARAVKRVPKDTPAQHRNGETIAYALEESAKTDIGNRIMDKIKIGLNRMGIPKDWLDDHESLLREIGRQNLGLMKEMPFQTPYGRTRTPSGAPVKPRLRPKSGQPPTGEQVKPRLRPKAVTPPPEAPETRAEPGAGEPQNIGTKNAAQGAAREERGLEPIESSMRPDAQQRWEQAGATLRRDPRAGQKLVSDILKNPRATSPDEEALLLQHGVNLHNQYDAATDDMDSLRHANAPQNKQLEARSRNAQIASQLDDLEAATKIGGEHWSDTGRIRQMLADRRYNLHAVERQYKAITGKDTIPEGEHADIKNVVKAIRDAQKGLDAAKDAAAGKPRTKKAPPTFDELAKQARALTDKAGKEPSMPSMRFSRTEDPELASLIRRMARNRSDAGITDPKAVVEAIHQALGGAMEHQDIKDTITSNKPFRTRTPTDEQKRYNELRTKLRDPDVQRNQRRMDQINARLAELQRRMADNDYVHTPKTRREYSEAVQAKQLELNRAIKLYQAKLDKWQRLNDTPLGRTFRFLMDSKLFSILASGLVYKKLGAAVATRNAGQLAEEGIGSVLAKVPGISKFAAASPRFHGQGFFRGLGEFGGGLYDAIERNKEDFRAGQNKWDVLYGNKHGFSQEFTEMTGNLRDALSHKGVDRITEGTHALARTVGASHAMIKEFVSEPEMRVAQFKIGLWYRQQLAKQGLSGDALEHAMARESTQSAINTMAYGHALESKFQGRNAATDATNSFLRTLQQGRYGEGGKALGFAVKQEFPIRGIPMNIAKELLVSYPFGVAIGIGKMMAHWRGFDELPPAQKAVIGDAVMRNLRKGTLGLATLGAMFFNSGMSSHFGGIQGAEKKKGVDIKPNESEFGGHGFGTETMHGPWMEYMELAASTQRIYQNEYGAAGLPAFLKAFSQAYVSATARAVPLIDQPRRQEQTYHYAQKQGRGLDKIAGEMLRSNFEPALLQQYAGGRIPYTEGWPGVDPRGPVWTQPRNIPEDLMTGLPWLRKYVPEEK